MKLSVILPTRNEEVLIKKTVTAIYKHVRTKGYPFEILVVLNGSVDKTEHIVKPLAHRIPQVKVLKSKPGYGYATRKGMKEAKGDYVIIYNVDFYDFRLVDLVNRNMDGKDIIIGSKLARGSEDRRPFSRHMISLFFNWYLKLFYGFRGTDTHGIKIMKAEVIKNILPKCKTNTGIFDTELILKAQRTGFKISEIPVSIKERRSPRFVGRLMQTPLDMYALYQALK